MRTEALAHNLVLFVRALRQRGLRLAPTTAGDLAAAVEAVGLADHDDLRAAFRGLTVARPAEIPVFDEVFDLFFRGGFLRPAPPNAEDTMRLPRGDEEPTRLSVPVLVRGDLDAERQRTVEEVVGGSYAERLAERDFAELTPEEAEEVRRLVAAMVWKPADAPSRRRQPDRNGRYPDLRRTMRGLVGPKGDLMPLAFSSRRVRRRPLVVIADVSGSMEAYTEMMLHFVHAAQGRLGRVEAFVFSTRLTRITRDMRRRSPTEALARVASTVQDWSGGTRIGEALEAFNRRWSRRVTRGGAIGLVVSDGWDTGDPALLHREMARFARSMHRVVWLNPLAGRPGFAPETRGLRTVLPLVDDFLPAGNLNDLRGVVRLLESIPPRRGARR